MNQKQMDVAEKINNNNNNKILRFIENKSKNLSIPQNMSRSSFSRQVKAGYHGVFPARGSNSSFPCGFWQLPHRPRHVGHVE